jgi:phosphate transport system permease protein
MIKKYLYTGDVFALGMLIWILGDVLIKGIPSLQLHFFFEREIGLDGGFLNAIIGSLQLVGLALLIATPLAIGAAIYIQEYAKHNNPFTRVILFPSDTLASTPSIVFGGFGEKKVITYLKQILSSGGMHIVSSIGLQKPPMDPNKTSIEQNKKKDTKANSKILLCIIIRQTTKSEFFLDHAV